MKKYKDLNNNLLIQRKKYFLLSFLGKAKKIVVNFLQLQNIPQKNIAYHTIAKLSEKAKVYAPTTFEKIGKTETITLKNVETFCFKDLYVSTSSTFFLDNRLKNIYYEKTEDFHNDYCLLYNNENLLVHSEKLAKIKKLPFIKKDEEVIFMGGTFSFNYYHLLIEILSKVQFFESIPNHRNLKVIMDKSASENKNLKEISSYFLKDYKIEFLDSKKYYQFSKLWFITSPNSTVQNINESEKYLTTFTKTSKDSINYLRKVCLEQTNFSEKKTDLHAKIFLARKSKFRVYNESEILAIAERYGFKAFYFEELNIQEQISIMKNAKYVVGPSGAAWTNIIFCEEKQTRGLIWLGNVWGDFSVYSTLAKISDISLYHLRFETTENKFHSNYNLNPSLFETELKKLLEQ